MMPRAVVRVAAESLAVVVAVALACALAVALAGVLGGCGGDDKPPPEPPYTIGAGCQTIGAAMCARGAGCGLVRDVEMCRRDVYRGCCLEGATCLGEAAPGTRARVQACAMHIAGLSCVELGSTKDLCGTMGGVK
jgi:hypothetical protein